MEMLQTLIVTGHKLHDKIKKKKMCLFESKNKNIV